MGNESSYPKLPPSREGQTGSVVLHHGSKKKLSYVQARRSQGTSFGDSGRQRSFVESRNSGHQQGNYTNGASDIGFKKLSRSQRSRSKLNEANSKRDSPYPLKKYGTDYSTGSGIEALPVPVSPMTGLKLLKKGISSRELYSTREKGRFAESKIPRRTKDQETIHARQKGVLGKS